MVTTTEQSPATALTVRGRDQLTEGVDVSDITNASPTRIEIALDYVRRATETHENAAVQRLYFWGLARQYGATFQQIADAAELTDAAIRIALKRNGGTE